MYHARVADSLFLDTLRRPRSQQGSVAQLFAANLLLLGNWQGDPTLEHNTFVVRT